MNRGCKMSMGLGKVELMLNTITKVSGESIQRLITNESESYKRELNVVGMDLEESLMKLGYQFRILRGHGVERHIYSDVDYTNKHDFCMVTIDNGRKNNTGCQRISIVQRVKGVIIKREIYRDEPSKNKYQRLKKLPNGVRDFIKESHGIKLD